MSDVADFRSDTLTKPSPAMRAAMASAEVGDDVFGEDPTVARLEADTAALLGKESAVFVPSGTMANQIAVHVHCRSGDELICEERSHVFFYEGGSAARLSGTQIRTVSAQDGFPTPQQVLDACRPLGNDHYPRTRLLVIENSHNMAGGRILHPVRMAELAAAASQKQIKLHVDGARLLNAAVALGSPPSALVAGADSVSLCLSKGLGAPVGSLLAGSAEFVKEARRARKAFGGGMRQVGVLAAAGLIALHEGPALLATDHRRAKRLAEHCVGLPGLAIDPRLVETNIVIVQVPKRDPSELVRALAEQNVKSLVVGKDKVRFVLHRDLTDAHIEQCLLALSRWARSTSH